MKCTYQNENLVVGSIYGPNIDSPQFFKAAQDTIQKMQPEKVVLGGDMNTVLDPGLDRSDQKLHKNSTAGKMLENIIEAENWTDVWRDIHPFEPGYTWKRTRPTYLAERLDYIFISDCLSQYVQSIRTAKGYRTDHQMVELEMKICGEKRGPGYWKLNTSLLRDKDFVEKINALIDIELAQTPLYESKRKHWEIIKLTIRGSILQYAARKMKSQNNTQKILEHKLEFWKKERDKINEINIKADERVECITRELELIETQKAQAAILRSKANWAENAEKPTKYFLNLEKSNFNRKTIHRLSCNDTIVEGNEQVQKMLDNYYSSLYKADKKYDESYIRNVTFPNISEEKKIEINRPITEKEISLALSQLKANKSPGVDGLPAEFYKVFWPKLKNFFVDLIQEICEVGELHSSAKRGIISLLEKPEKNPLKIENWRPISLLCVDYKIFSKIIALRLQNVLPEIIHESQTGFMKGRNIGENTLKMLSLMEFCEQSKTSAVVITYDFHKAFDKVSWKAIEKALECFALGEYITSLIKVLYRNTESCVMNNGYWGQWFKLGRSTRQGCPSSALIFNLVVEILGIKIRKNIKIKGIEMFDFELKSQQYADDIWMALYPTEQNINEALKEMENFANFSGLEINFEKTIAYKLGPCRNSEARFYTIKPISWTNEPVKILGIWFHPSKQIMVEKNFYKKLDKIQTIIENWNTRNLSTLGKITVINTLIHSQLQYQLTSLPSPPQDFYIKYKRIIQEYLWKKTAIRIRYEKIIQNYENEGLKLLDLQTKEIALKAKWPIYFQYRHIPWFYGWYPVKDERVWTCNINEKDIRNSMFNTTFRDIWIAWSKVFFHIPESIDEIMTQNIWGNSHVKRAGKPFFDKEGFNSFIDSPQFLIKQDGTLKEWELLLDIEKRNLKIMTYNQIKAAIPKLWLQIIKNNLSHTPTQSKLEKLESYTKPAKVFYWELVEKKKIKMVTKANWERELDTNITDQEWENMFANTKRLISIVKIRDFQYKTVQRYLITNVRRNKMNSDISSLCSFCYQHPETLYHMFISCEKVVKMWNIFKRWCNYFYKTKIICLKPEEIIFNALECKNKNFINLLILLMKRYIYVARCKENQLDFQAYLRFINYVMKLEKLACTEPQQYRNFEKKWKLYIKCLE